MKYFSRYWIEFIYVMTVKEIKARYKRVLFGFLWAFINPVIQMLVIGVVFQYFVPLSIENYFQFLFSGLIVWNFMSSTLTTCTPVILNERPLIQKAKFPRESLILSIILSNMFHFLVTVVLFVIVSLIFGLNLTFNLLTLLVVSIVWLFIFTIGISFVSATLFVRFRDTKFIVQSLLSVWFYATPIIYSRGLLDFPLNRILLINPLTPIIEMFQYTFTGNGILSFQDFLPSLIVTLVTFFIGISIFVNEQQYFDDWL